MRTQAPSLTEQLAQRLLQPVDAQARRRAALLLLDWLGCALGGLRSELGQTLWRIAADSPAAGGDCVALGVGQRSLEDALALNAALGNVLEMDDLHREAILHPGPVVIPLALALTQAGQHGREALLDAIVRGYECAIRIGRSLGREHYRYWHPTSTVGAFAAAATAGSLRALDAQTLADALGTAGSSTGGLWQMRHEAAPTKSLHNAEAARRGLQAVRWAAAGLRGPRQILEGEQGLYAATAPGAEPTRVVEAAADWLIHDTSLKPWPACRHVHPSIDAMLAAWSSARSGVAVGEVVSIDVASYPEALRFCDREQPRTELEAKFSLQHAVAGILLLGPPKLDHYQPALIARADLAALRQRVKLVCDPQLGEAFPRHYGAQVRIHLRDGGQLTARLDDALGDPERPLTLPALCDKARALALWAGFDESAVRALVDACLSLREGGDPAGLSAALLSLQR